MGQGASAEAAPYQAASRGAHTGSGVCSLAQACTRLLGLRAVGPPPRAVPADCEGAFDVKTAMQAGASHRTALCLTAAAAAAGDAAALEQWLKSGGNPNAVHSTLHCTALQAAARGDHVECIEVGACFELVLMDRVPCDGIRTSALPPAHPGMHLHAQQPPALQRCLAAARRCCCAMAPTSTSRLATAGRCTRPPAAAATAPSPCCCAGACCPGWGCQGCVHASRCTNHS